MVREYFKEFRSDREYADRLTIDGTRLKGDDVEGFWIAMQVTLAENSLANISSESHLSHYVLTQYR